MSENKEALVKFTKDVQDLAAVLQSRAGNLAVQLMKVRDDEYRISINGVVAVGRGMQMVDEYYTVWLNQKTGEVSYCEGILRQYAPKDIN